VKTFDSGDLEAVLTSCVGLARRRASMALMSPGTAFELKMRNILRGTWNAKRWASKEA
jgi:hypothetical protein